MQRHLKNKFADSRAKAPENFKQIAKEAEKLDIEPPVVPRWRRLPRRIELTVVQITQDSLHLSNFLLHNKLLI